ncbi:AraC family transcriptional regulator [Ralstonia sp. A12]|uniref:AraC family transcriptional regulator n=1 Tax=Ralstonia sp. A12 TaxID=1217052 RepID=UPI000A6A9811|nr:AraC family transcriptional regulator [Ralstonia sp. A12]
MHVHLQCDFQVRLHRLLPAFPWVIVPTSGRSVIRRRGFDRVLAPGQQLVVAPFEPIELLLDGKYKQPAACAVEVQSDMPRDLGESALYRAISQRVFLQPQQAWDASYLSRLLDMPALEIRRKLFTQGYALTDIRRTQRLMRALFEVVQRGNRASDLKRCIGWPVHGDLESAFHDRFGLSLLTAERLSGTKALGEIEALPALHRQMPRWHDGVLGKSARAVGAHGSR